MPTRILERPDPDLTETSRVTLAAAIATAAAGEYPAVAITAGLANGLTYSAEVIHGSLPLWEGINVFTDHASQADWGRPGGRSVRDLAGVLHSTYWDATRAAICGTIHFLTRTAWLTAILDEWLALVATGQPAPNIGLSADLEIERKGEQVTKITRVFSLDVVMNPARGGQLETAALGTIYERRVLAMTDPTPTPIVSTAVVPPPAAAVAPPVAAPPPDVLQEAQHLRIAIALAQSALPIPLREVINDSLERVGANLAFALTPYEITDTIRRAEAAYAKTLEPHVIQHLGVVQAMTVPTDRLALAFDRLMGLKIPEGATDIPRLSGIREFYLICTGDYEMHGQFHADRVSLANMNSSTLSSMVKNALNKVLLQAYEARPFWWTPIVYEEDFSNLNDITWITAGGFADLPTVPEGNEYTEAANMSDIEETSAFLKKGVYAGIPLEAIDRDNVGLIRAIPRKLGLAANRTLSATIAAIFTANSGVGPTLGQDNTALFHTNHANLGATALSTATWDAAVVAMFKQAEPASNKRLGLRPAFLIVPIELEYTARQIMESAEFTGGTTSVLIVNPRYRSAGVVVAPEFTDPNDWATCANPMDAAGICVGYRYGRVPELFIAQDPLTGSMFTADTMRLKVRFYFTVGIGEYRSLYKANVT